MNKKNTIFFSLNNDYVPFFSVALQSLLDNISKSDLYSIRVLHSDISINNQRILKNQTKNIVEIEFVDMNEKIKEYQLQPFGRFSADALLRFFIPNICEGSEKALYLDSDLIVLDDINTLFETDLGCNCMGVVRDLLVEQEQTYVERNVLADTDKYFNSGVLLFNIPVFNEHNCLSKIIELYKADNDFRYMDQDILNIVCEDKVKYIDLEWNAQRHHCEEKLTEEKRRVFDKSFESAKIVHYTGEKKPWIFTNIEYAGAFWEYAAKSPFFKDILKTGGELRNLYRIDYLFPISKIKKDAKIVLYGAGEVGKVLKKQIEASQIGEIVAWVDKNSGRPVYGERIISPEEIKHYSYDIVLIAIASKDIATEIKEYLYDLGISKEKIIWENPVLPR